jgi:hypothetical protein
MICATYLCLRNPRQKENAADTESSAALSTFRYQARCRLDTQSARKISRFGPASYRYGDRLPMPGCGKYME